MDVRTLWYNQLLTQQQFKDWLEELKDIWETKKPDAVLNLCAKKFLWYETPFNEPLTTEGQLLKEWQNVLNQEDIYISYQILSTNENTGIAQWHATFTRLSSKKKSELDGIFQVSLDKQGRCIEFHQWYNSRE